jgi:hypothetical protein
VEIPSDDDPTISFANTDMDITTTPLVPVAALPSNRQDVLEADVSTALAATVMSVEHGQNDDGTAKTSERSNRHSLATDSDAADTDATNIQIAGHGESSNVVDYSSKRRNMLQEPSLHPGAVAVSGMRQQNTENIQHTPERIVEINRRQSPSVEEERPWPEDHAFVSSQSYGKEQEDSGDERQNQIDRSSYLIEAELVSPPIQAVSVMIDEEQPHNPHLEQRLGSSMQGSDRKEMPDPASDETTRQLKRWIYGLVTIVAILFVIVLASVVVAIVTKSRDPNDSVAPTEDTAATFDNHCYRSTRDLLLAQIDDFVESRKTKICTSFARALTSRLAFSQTLPSMTIVSLEETSL